MSEQQMPLTYEGILELFRQTTQETDQKWREMREQFRETDQRFQEKMDRMAQEAEQRKQEMDRKIQETWEQICIPTRMLWMSDIKCRGNCREYGQGKYR